MTVGAPTGFRRAATALALLAGLLLAGCGEDEPSPPDPQDGKGAQREADRQDAPDALTVRVEGEAQTLTPAAMDALPTVEVRSDRGMRRAWDLRMLAARLGGAGARVTALSDGEGASVVIAPRLWDDPARVPVLRRNRRGALRFQWADAQGGPMERSTLARVVVVEIARAPR